MCDPHHVGQIEFLGMVAAFDVQQPMAQGARGCRHDAGVDLTNPLLRRRGLALLDDGLHLSRGVADDAPVALGVVQLDAEHGQ